MGAVYFHGKSIFLFQFARSTKSKFKKTLGAEKRKRKFPCFFVVVAQSRVRPEHFLNRPTSVLVAEKWAKFLPM
jgi:hypothetical protein